MARETIASVKRELRDERKRLLGINSGESAAHKVQLELANDYVARLIADKVELIRRHTEELNRKDDRIGELIRGHAEALSIKDHRIGELLDAASKGVERERSLRGENKVLQKALTDATRVIATLGQRPEA